MKTLIAVLVLAAGSAVAEEDSKPILVIATTGGASVANERGGSTIGGLAGVYNEAGRFRYGLTALATGGQWQWSGASLDARWSFLDSDITPYAGAGLGVFSARRAGLDSGLQPTATAEAGVQLWRFFAGARALIPLSQRSGG